MSETPGDDDARLVRRVAEDRDESALAKLMARHAPKVAGYLQRRFQRQLRHPEIDEAVNRAAMKIWENAHRFDGTKSFGPWFLTIALRAALDILRGEASRPTCSLQFDPSDTDPELPEEELDSSPRVAWCVKQLEQIIEHELMGFEQVVAEADLAAGGSADTELLMKQHGKTKNVVQATRSKVWKKIRETILKREILRDRTKVNP